MDHDLTMMIYGAIMGVVGSIISSLVTALFQLWLARREYEHKQSEQRSRQLKQIYIPTDEEVMRINSGRDAGDSPELQRKAAETGSLVLSSVVGGVLVYQTNDPLLGFAFTAMLFYVGTNRFIRSLKR